MTHNLECARKHTYCMTHLLFVLPNFLSAGQRGTFSSLLYIHPDHVSHGREPLVCLEIAFTHTFTHGRTHRHTITQYSLKVDLIKPEGKCNYVQPSSALFSFVMATFCLLTELLGPILLSFRDFSMH